MLDLYLSEEIERKKQGLPPLPLSAKQTASLIELLKNDSANNSNLLLSLLENRVPAGVDQAAFVKAAFLNDVAINKTYSPYISDDYAIKLLGTMLGGYNVQSLIALLETDKADQAVKALSKITLIFDAFYDVEKLHKDGNSYATNLIKSWAEAEWFTSKNAIPETFEVVVLKVDGETNTDDLSPAQDAWSRADIPLHANSMFINKIPNISEIIEKLKSEKLPIAFVGDIVGTGSSRKSAINSLQWHFGKKIPYMPNKNSGGIILGNKIAPIFFNTAEDSGALPIQCDVSSLNTGDIVKINLK